MTRRDLRTRLALPLGFMNEYFFISILVISFKVQLFNRHLAPSGSPGSADPAIELLELMRKRSDRNLNDGRLVEPCALQRVGASDGTTDLS